MKHLKRFFITVLFCSLSFAVLVAWFSPQLIQWYFTPPVQPSLNCSPVVAWSIETYRKLLVGGCIGGSIFGAIVYFALLGWQKKPVDSTTNPPA